MRRLVIWGLFVLSLVACGGDASKTPPSTIVPTPTLAAGTASVVGQVTSVQSGKPLANRPVWLAPITYQGDEGVYALDTAFSPGSKTDQDGKFRIVNVEPKDYVLVVGDPNSDYQIISEPSGKARVWKLQADQTLDVGVLNVTLKP